MRSIKNGAESSQDDYPGVFYFTFLNFGALKNIILKLSNNIEKVRPGTI